MMRRTPMRRSGFASQWQPRPKTERTLMPIRAVAPSAPIFHQTPKTEYVRDEGYRRYVASLPCFECGIVGFSQAAHSNQGGDGKGLGIKASDVNLFPLCCTRPGRVGCHEKHDLLIGMDLEERKRREGNYLKRLAQLGLRHTQKGNAMKVESSVVSTQVSSLVSKA